MILTISSFIEKISNGDPEAQVDLAVIVLVLIAIVPMYKHWKKKKNKKGLDDQI